MSEWLKEAASKTVDRPKAVRRFESCRFRSCKGLAKVLANPFCIPPPPQTVRKVLARLKYSVPLYKAESGFSILTEEYLTFLTGSPNEAGRIYEYNEQQKRLSCSLLFHVFFVVSIMKHQFLKQLTLEMQFVRETAGFHGQVIDFE